MAALKRQVFVGNEGVVNFEAVEDLYKDIMLITATCGRGKTSFALELGASGLMAALNKKMIDYIMLHREKEYIKPDEILFVTTRSIIFKQQLKKKGVEAAAAYHYSGYTTDYLDFTDSSSGNSGSTQEEKIKVITAHKLGDLIREGLIKKLPRVVIFDELHSLFSESIFAEQLSYTLAWLKENYADMIKIGLTATPEFLYDYIQAEDDTLSFKEVDKPLGSKYKSTEIKLLLHGKAESVLSSTKYDKDNKFIYYTQSARKCYALSQEYKRTAFLISDWNESETEDKVLLVDKMCEAGVKDYITQYERLPSDIDGIFINSACREGMNINDSSVKTIICEATDLITIQQILGRVRNDIDKFIIVANGNNKAALYKQIKEVQAFLNEYNLCDTDELKQIALIAERYGKQSKDKYMPKIVYKYRDEYRLNAYALAYLCYKYDSYSQVFNYKAKERIISVGKRRMLNTLEYINKLQPFSDNDIIIKFAEAVIKQNKQERSLEAFEAIANKYCDKLLTKEDKAALCQEIEATRAEGKKANWTTVKDWLIEAGYTITDTTRTVSGKRQRVSIISRM